MAFRIGQQVIVVKGPYAGRLSTVESGLLPTPCKSATAHALSGCFCKYGNPLVHVISLPAPMEVEGVVSRAGAPPEWLVPLVPEGTEAEILRFSLKGVIS